MGASDKGERELKWFLAILVVGFLGLAGSIIGRDALLHLALEKRGVTAEAEVTRVWEKLTPRSRGPSTRSWQVDYAFTTRTGRVVEVTTAHPASVSPRLKRGMTGPVTYLPDEPMRHSFALLSWRFPFLLMAIVLVMALVIAVLLHLQDRQARRTGRLM